jgi:hypothetical protein
MSQLIKAQKTRIELADILRKHLREYQNSYPMSPQQYRIVFNILNCRTAHMGGHMQRCDHCGAERVMYHSCRNRHCPKCQQIPREKWLEARKSELLPVTYFHVVFTLPHALNPIILRNKSLMLNILFKAVSKTLTKFGNKELGGKLGFMAVLHTWDQQLKAHFHLHCLVAGGAVSSKTKQWIPCKDNYLFNQEALSLVFRGKFMDHLKRTIGKGKLKGDISYQQLRHRLYKNKWVVSVREPIKQPQHVLQYIARYTHRVAIANSRITDFQNTMVSFRYKERKNNVLKKTTIDAVQFIRRFLLHTLPQGFVRIRHYGFLANRNRKANLNFIRQLLKVPYQLRKITHSLQKMMLKITGIDITLCPCCKKGKMQPLTVIPRHRGKHPHSFIRPPNALATVTG